MKIQVTIVRKIPVAVWNMLSKQEDFIDIYLKRLEKEREMEDKLRNTDSEASGLPAVQPQGRQGKFPYGHSQQQSPLHRNVIAVIYYPQHGKPKIYFSIDLSLSGEQVVEFYRPKFHTEVCIRDARQYTDPGDSRSRKSRAPDFAVNLLLCRPEHGQTCHP